MIPDAPVPKVRRSRLGLSKLAIVGLASVMLAACSPGSDGGQEGGADSESTSVTVAMPDTSEPESGFNPVHGWGAGGHAHEPLIQSTLITTDVDMEFENDLATEYSVSDDGLLWSFTIRDDVKFSDGEPLTASDVAFTIDQLLTDKSAEADLTMVKSVEATDDTHVEIHLDKPYNALLYTLAVVGIVPEDSYDDTYGENPIGSGRYLLEEWTQGEEAIFVPNPDYYGEAPVMERVVVAFMEEDAALAAVRAGQVDVAFTSSTYAEQEIDGYELLSLPTVDSRGLSLPTEPSGGEIEVDDAKYAVGNDLTSDLDVRRAMFYALDRDSLIDGVLKGHGTPAFNVSDGMPWSNPELEYERDVDKAKQLLDEAGWEDNGGVREKDGVPAQLDVYYPANDTTRQALAAEFSNQMGEIGIDVEGIGKPWDEIYDHQFSDPVVWGWGSNSPDELYNLYYSTGWGNFASYENEAIDKHLDDALAHGDVEDSFEDWQAALWDGKDGIGVEGAATWLWMANVDHLYFARDGLDTGQQKLHPHGHGWSVVNNVDQWTWN